MKPPATFASRTLAKAISTLMAVVTMAFAQERGTLVVSTTPDSAVVILDGASVPERQRTPYRNESMIPGRHFLTIRSSNPAHTAARYEFEIPAGQSVFLDHDFAFRTKASGMEALSIAPWVVGVDVGLDYRRYLGFSRVTSGDSVASAVTSFPDTYPSDSQPSSLRIPLTLRVGLPGGFETRFVFPFAGRTESDGTGGFGLGDAALGAKWTYAGYNSALDLQWRFGNAVASRLGERSNSLELSLITNQRWKMIDALGQVGWRGIFQNLDDDSLSPGDEVFARARGGYLLADRFLPHLSALGSYRLPDARGAVESDPSFQLTLVPGLVVYAGRSADLEVGVPLRLVASNTETSWGLHASVAMRFGLPRNAASNARSGVPVTGSVYSAPRITAPASSPSHIVIDAREVTNAEYRNFCDKTAREYPRDPDFPGMTNYLTDPAYARYPVVNVSLEDARAYAAWVGKRLPTVAEWRKEFQESALPLSAVACGIEAPEEVDSRKQGVGYRHFVGNVAEWVENDRSTGSAAYIAGGFFSLPRERCLDKGRWIDIASPTGARYIGIRLATEVK